MSAPGKKLEPNKPPAPGYVRRFPRFAIDVRLQVRMFQNGEFRNCWGRSTELGQDGIGATHRRARNRRDRSLDIPLPLSPYPVKVRAIVRYRQGCATVSNSLPSTNPARRPPPRLRSPSHKS